MPKKIDLTGKKFNRLTVIKEVGRDNQGFVTWLCKCDCGNEVVVTGASLRRGNTKSCGCLIHDILVKRNTKHNMVGTRFYEIWASMKKRCLNSKSKAFKHYGARGIKVCDRWSSFENFYNDMFQSYLDHVEKYGESETTLDRIDVNGNYSLGNCRWSTWKEQANNRSNSRYIPNTDMTIAQASDRYGIKYTIIIGRLKNGKDIFGNTS